MLTDSGPEDFELVHFFSVHHDYHFCKYWGSCLLCPPAVLDAAGNSPPNHHFQYAQVMKNACRCNNIAAVIYSHAI